MELHPKTRKLTKEELREYNDAYEMAISDDRPYITSSRLKELVKSLGFNPSDNQLNNMYLEVDYDRNGKLSFEEFVDLIEVLKNPNAEEQSMLESFRAFDSYNNGFVPATEIREALLYVMERSLPHEKESIIKAFGLDKDRKVSFAEFKNMVSTDECMQAFAQRNNHLTPHLM